MDHLTATLLDLLHELEGQQVPLAVGGGFGLYLKRQHLAATREPTLFDRMPEPRSTNDLDLFLRVEVLADLARTQKLKAAIRRLDYGVVEEAKFLQWRRQVMVRGLAGEVKIDFLVGPIAGFRRKLKISMPRVRPRGSIEFHAHAVAEAVRIEDEPIAVTIAGSRSNGDPYVGTVYIPQAFPYLMMKLHAFEDRKNKGQVTKAQHHALDLYTIVAMMTEHEYERANEFAAAHADEESVIRACRIVRDHFSGATAVESCGSRNTRCSAKISWWSSS